MFFCQYSFVVEVLFSSDFANFATSNYLNLRQGKDKVASVREIFLFPGEELIFKMPGKHQKIIGFGFPGFLLRYDRYIGSGGTPSHFLRVAVGGGGYYRVVDMAELEQDIAFGRSAIKINRLSF